MGFLVSKFFVPEVAAHDIDRPRLTDRFRRRARVFVLAAPAGYGKTVLASQVLSKVPPADRAWIHLDERDREPGRFGAYLLEALSGPLPLLRKSDLQPKLMSRQIGLEEAAEDLLLLLQEYSGPPAWLVLDNWETVDAEREIVRFIGRVVRYGSERLKLVINSRTTPSFKVWKLAEQGRTILLTKDDLAFTFAEFLEAFERRSTNSLPEEDLEKLWRHTAGWCVNLGLILEVLRHRDPDQSIDLLAKLGDAESLVAYVEEEILPEIPEDLLSFLSRCSILDVLSPESCAMVLDDQATVRNHLTALEASAIPHFRLSQSDGYRLHPAVNQALQRILRRTSSAAELHTLYRRAAEVCIEQNEILEGVRLLVELPDHEAALSAIRANWYKLLAVSAQAQIRTWLESFPADVRSHPTYIELRTNLFSIAGDNRSLITYLSDKIGPSAFPENSEILANCWMHYQWARLHETDKPLYEATRASWKRLRAARGPFNAMLEAGVENVLAVAAFNELRHAVAHGHLTRCFEIQEERSFDYQISTRSNLALVQHHQGDASGALAAYEGCVRDCELHSAYTSAPHALRGISECLYALGRFEEAVQAADRCSEVMREHEVQNLGVEIGLDRVRGVCLWFMGRWGEALECFTRVHRHASTFSSVEAVGAGLLLEYYGALAGRNSHVVSDDVIPPTGRISENRMIYLAKAAWDSIEGSHGTEAAAAAEELRRAAEERKLQPWLTAAHFLAAAASRSGGEARAGRRHLTKGLEALGSTDWACYPMINPWLSAFVLTKAVRLGTLVEVASRLRATVGEFDLSAAVRTELEDGSCAPAEAERLLQAATSWGLRGMAGLAVGHTGSRRASLAAAARLHLETVGSRPLPPLRIRMLGSFGVSVQGREVHFPRRKSRLLLQMLLVEHPAPIHQEVLMEELWPDAEPDKARMALQTAIRDLRRALDPAHEPRASSYVEHCDEQYSLFLPEGSFCDAHVWRRTVRSWLGRVDGRRQLVEEEVRDMRQALALFGGEFLPGQRYESFTVETRERLHREFHDATLLLGRHCNASGRHRDAIDILQRGIELDPLWGEGIQEMMVARAGNGEICRALRLYRDYEARLRRELDLPPDRQIQGCFKELVSSGIRTSRAHGVS